MTWIYTPYAGVLWATAAVSILVTIIIARKPKTAAVNSLILLMGAIAMWSLASGLEAASIGLSQKLVWAKVEYLGVVSVPGLFFVFTLEYSRQSGWPKKLNLIYLAIIPTVGLILALTNEYHHLIWNNFFVSSSEPNTIIYGHGIGFYVLSAYNYFLGIAGIVILLRAWLKFPITYRRQIAVILVGAIFPVASGLIYLLGLMPLPGLDLPPISFLATSLFITFGIFAYQLFDVVPITSDSVIEHMVDGVVVVDVWDHIANVNTVAEKLIHSLSKDAIGQPVQNYLDFWQEVQNHHVERVEVNTEVLYQQKPAHYLDVHISPLYDRRRYFAGRLIVLRDTTERRKTEMDLARNVEELKIINRIGLIITSGLDLERTLKALYEQCSRVAPNDVFYVALYNQASSLVTIPLYFEMGRCLTGISRDIRDRPGLIGSVINAGKTLYLRDGIKQVTRPIVTPDSPTAPPINSYIGIPLKVRDQIVGVMAIQSRRINAFTEDQLRLLERIAVQAAIAIENARLYAEEERLAIIDELTGVYNYRGLLELGTREVERARRFNRPLAAVFFDIDDFRKLNNTYSHSTGNIVLQAVVKRCSSVLRSVDVLTRFGGDEFVALLPETDLASANAVAQRLSEEVANNPVHTSYGDLKVTISIGLSILTGAMQDLHILIDYANQAERQAKQDQKKNTHQLG